MIKVTSSGKDFESLDFSEIDQRGLEVADKIDNRTGAGNDFLGWTNYTSKLPESEVKRIIATAQRIRENYDCLVVVGIGGSYLGARAAIEAINGLYSKDNFEIIFLGNTLSSTYTKQVLDYLENKKFAVNVISKSGTTTEPAVAFRLLKNLIIRKRGFAAVKDAVIATTDAHKGALKTEADAEGYDTFVIPDDVGGRYSVITPVGLLPIACAGIDIVAYQIHLHMDSAFRVRDLQLTKNHEGDDQTIQSDTFGHSYEDHGFTKDAAVFADCSKSCACGRCNGDTGTNTGKTCNKSCTDVTKTGCKTSACFCCSRCSCCACEGNNGCDQQKAEEAAYIGCQRFFVTIFVVLTFEVISHRNNDG